MIRVESLSPHFAERYEAFILERPYTLVYQSWRYQNLLCDLLGCRQKSLLALDKQNNILAALPLMAKDGPLGTVLNSLPFYGSNGALIGEDLAARAALMGAFLEMAQAPGVAASTLIENPLAPAGDDELAYDLIDRRIGQLTPLPSEGDIKGALMQSFHYKTRNMVRKANKLGIDVDENFEAVPFLIEIHEKNMREIGGLPKPRSFFESLPQYFRPRWDYRVYVARLRGELVAALLVFFYNRTAEYYTPAVRKEYRGSQALSALIFKAMGDAAENGYTWWNWGGTWLSQDGVYRFKSRWGTLDMPYRYLVKIQNPSILRSNPKKLRAEYPYFFTLPFSALSS